MTTNEKAVRGTTPGTASKTLNTQIDLNHFAIAKTRSLVRLLKNMLGVTALPTDAAGNPPERGAIAAFRKHGMDLPLLGVTVRNYNDRTRYTGYFVLSSTDREIGIAVVRAYEAEQQLRKLTAATRK